MECLNNLNKLTLIQVHIRRHYVAVWDQRPCKRTSLQKLRAAVTGPTEICAISSNLTLGQKVQVLGVIISSCHVVFSAAGSKKLHLKGHTNPQKGNVNLLLKSTYSTCSEDFLKGLKKKKQSFNIFSFMSTSSSYYHHVKTCYLSRRSRMNRKLWLSHLLLWD